MKSTSQPRSSATGCMFLVVSIKASSADMAVARHKCDWAAWRGHSCSIAHHAGAHFHWSSSKHGWLHQQCPIPSSCRRGRQTQWTGWGWASCVAKTAQGMESSFLDFRIFRMSLIHTWPEKSPILHISIDRRVQSKDIHLETSIASGRSQSSAPHLRFEVPGPLIFLGQSCKWH